MVMSKPTMSDLFEYKQKEMANQLDLKLSHCVAQGDKSEMCWIEFFRQFLPSRYSCDKAFVMDSERNLSEQIDVVIYDRYFSPFFFNYGNSKYIPAESVYAVFEVKPEINKSNFEYSQRKIKSVRKLVRTSADVLSAGEKVSGRKPFTIMGGLLTTKGKWKRSLSKQTINIDDNSWLDIGCCLHSYSWWLHRDDKYILCEKDDHLLSFFMVLLDKLQKCGSVPALDISKYYSLVVE